MPPLPLPPLPSRRVRAGSIGSALNAAKLIAAATAAAAVSPATDVSAAGADAGVGGGAVLESRRERRERVGARERRGGGRCLIDNGGVEAEAEAGADAVRFGDSLLGERGLVCTVLLLPLVLGVSRGNTYGPVGEAGISTLLRTE